jgi:hypothetical protein
LSVIMLSVVMVSVAIFYWYVQRRYAEFRYTDCLGLFYVPVWLAGFPRYTT